jgi:hypothetical protein
MLQKLHNSPLRFYSLCLGALVLLYLPQLFGEFLGDDVGRIQNLIQPNPFEILYNGLGDRPLLVVSLWLDKFFFKFDVFGMRLENLLITSGIALLARIVISEVGSTLRLQVNPCVRDALLFLFIIHPLNTQAIGHVVQRGILFSTLFSLLSTFWLIKCRGNWREKEWKFALASWCLALLSKPNVAFMPIWWGLLYYIMGEKKRIPSLGFFFLMLIFPVINYSWGEFNIQKTQVSSLEYFLTQATSVTQYLKLMLIPWPLNFQRDFYFDSRPGLREILIWGGYLGGILFVMLKSRNPGVKLFFMGAVLAFLPESSFFPIIHSFFEHRAFTPFLFLISSLVFLPFHFKRIHILYGLLCVLFGGLTFARGVQVKNFEEWVKLETHQENCRAGYLVYYSTHELIKRERFEAVTWILNQTRKCMSPLLWSLLNQEMQLKKTQKFDPKILEALKISLHSKNDFNCAIRNISNTFLAEKLIQWNVENSSCLAEEHLSHQLKFLVSQEDDCIENIKHYLKTASSCMKYLSSENLEKSYQLLKIRTILYAYFIFPDPKLADDLRAQPQSERMEYLKELYQRAKRQKDNLSGK